MLRKNFISLFIFYSSFIWFYTFSYSVLPTHLLAQGISLKELVIGQWIRFAAQLLIIPFLIYLTARISWLLGIISSFLYIFLSIKVLSIGQFYLASIFGGFNITLFYVFYNIAHFKNTPKKKTGLSSSLIFSMPIIIGIVTPLISGYLKNSSEQLMWILSLIFFLMTIFLIRFQKDFKIQFSIRSALAEIKQTRLFLFLEGVWEALIFGFIPIYTLFYIKTPLGYGAFLSYIAIISATSSLALGHYTDRIRQRKIFIYPITILLTIVTVSFISATNNLTMWLVVVGVTQFLVQLFWNVLTAFVVDTHKNIELLMVGREICLALGKFVGLMIVYLSFVFEPKPFFLFFILAFAMLLIPLKLFFSNYYKSR